MSGRMPVPFFTKKSTTSIATRSIWRRTQAQPRYRFSMSSPRTASSTVKPANPSKPIVLEQPDKFRPPSHPARLTRRAPRAYNQQSTFQEQQAQKTRTYPHMFPDPGTTMHWFLTSKWIHVTITTSTLLFLAFIAATQSFIHTSPFGHLIPSISSFPAHPIAYLQETLSVLRLHLDYTTEKTDASRREKMYDAQKRRLYRRAHGMENLDAEEDEGVDVRGLVDWDDGLTNKERARGGRKSDVVSGLQLMEMGMRPDEDPVEFVKRRKNESAEGLENGGDQADAQQLLPEKRKRKLWFGIW